MLEFCRIFKYVKMRAMNKFALFTICFAFYACENFGQSGGTTTSENNKNMNKTPTKNATNPTARKTYRKRASFIIKISLGTAASVERRVGDARVNVAQHDTVCRVVRCYTADCSSSCCWEPFQDNGWCADRNRRQQCSTPVHR